MTRFKIIGAADAAIVESELNAWVARLPKGSRVRRTQLACAGATVYALVSYEVPDPPEAKP